MHARPVGDIFSEHMSPISPTGHACTLPSIHFCSGNTKLFSPYCQSCSSNKILFRAYCQSCSSNSQGVTNNKMFNVRKRTRSIQLCITYWGEASRTHNKSRPKLELKSKLITLTVIYRQLIYYILTNLDKVFHVILCQQFIRNMFDYC